MAWAQMRTVPRLDSTAVMPTVTAEMGPMVADTGTDQTSGVPRGKENVPTVSRHGHPSTKTRSTGIEPPLAAADRPGHEAQMSTRTYQRMGVTMELGEEMSDLQGMIDHREMTEEDVIVARIDATIETVEQSAVVDHQDRRDPEIERGRSATFIEDRIAESPTTNADDDEWK